jgi:serine/threonine-protein kinase RsbW
VSNELAALSVLQAAAGAFLRSAEADNRLSRRIELVLEEVFTNILEHNYLPGQRERVHTTLGIENGVLAVTIRFKGIPFDVDYLRSCADNGDMIDACGRGIGLRLIRQLVDRIEYRNLGKEGQEIALFLEIPTNGLSVVESDCAGNLYDRNARAFAVNLRRMLPSEAATVSKLAYFAYDYSYAYGHMYDPQKVRTLNEEGRLFSFVAVDKEIGVIGHFALSRDDASDLMEMCAGFVDPRYRGHGSMNAMAAQGIEEAQSLGAEGVFVIAVTAHPYSQKAALLHGLKETALFISCVQALAIRAIHEEKTARESVIFMASCFDPKPRGPYYLPAHHRNMLERICRNAGIEASFGECRGEISLPEHGELETKKDDYQAGHIHVHGYGRDTVPQIRRCLRLWQLERLETVFLYLPLHQPPTAVLCRSFEEMGFFFSGLRPGRAGRDWLVLQFLNNQRYDYDSIKTATDFGRELAEYVRDRDPVRLEVIPK